MREKLSFCFFTDEESTVLFRRAGVSIVEREETIAGVEVEEEAGRGRLSDLGLAARVELPFVFGGGGGGGGER